MADFPTEIDGPSTLYSAVDAFSTKPLETTATGAIGAGDSTISVQSTAGGFAATYGILSIDDELIVYTAKTGTQFTGCQRGAFGTPAATHASGVAVKANMVSGFINPDFPPIVLTGADEAKVQVIAEVVEVLGAPASRPFQDLRTLP
jgi:hypothetical protein